MTSTPQPDLLIGFHGFPRSGKDTAAGALIRDGFERIALADPLRVGLRGVDPYLIASDPTVLPRRLSELLDEFGGSEGLKAQPLWCDEYRRLSQNYGTEGGRDIHGDDCWVKAAERRISHSKVVVTDVRFPNEAEWLRSLGGLLIQVVRPGVGAANSHASEQTLPCDVTVNNDSDITTLYENTRSTVAEFALSKNLETP